ncbi:MAG TPA: VWA domain-containing protein, partial [Vicinamibacterales bacterium]|nr:VWA domain-containing protein [Vicinamibacterales bacterium]
QPTFRVNVNLVTTDVIVRDPQNGQFIADLEPKDFQVYEDGVKQDISSLVLVHGGRVSNVEAPPPPPVQEGIILPQTRPTNDASGRVFLIFIDDLHLDFRETPRTRQLLEKMLKELIHEGDMFGIVTTGPSSISQQLTYDRQVLESAIKRITGSALRPSDLIKSIQSSQGPSELRYRAHVAFSTAYDLMRNLEKLQNRRKAVIYISSGYDFNPFAQTRLEEQARQMGLTSDGSIGGTVDQSQLQSDPFLQDSQRQQEFGPADLLQELAELTRAANRANATFYTIDPRGLVAGPDIDEDEAIHDHPEEWQDYLQQTQDSLRILAEQTGGIAVVNQNDFDKALKRIDAETSDYYVLGYYSSNPDPLKRVRRIEVKTVRPGLSVWSRKSYSLRPTPKVK